MADLYTIYKHEPKSACISYTDRTRILYITYETSRVTCSGLKYFFFGNKCNLTGKIRVKVYANEQSICIRYTDTLHGNDFYCVYLMNY